MDVVSLVGVFVFLLVLKVKQEITFFYLLLHLRRRRAAAQQRLALTSLRLPPPPPHTRRVWMRVRSQDWWERVVLNEFNDQEWRENFRMSRRSFVKLCDLMKEDMSPEEETVRKPIPLPMRVAMVLYKLGSCAEYRVIANQFGVHKSTVRKFVYMFCKSMVKGPIKQLNGVPLEEEALDIASKFEATHNIPNVMGIIDGTHIPILPPSDGYKDFVNRKGWPSYVLQAVVDHKFW